MSAKEDWDIEQYKVEHECDEHWELRRQFLLAHKDKFPEDELVCLAQVFTNVELLGCRYPNETMQLIAELSKDVAADYREKQKSKLKRTFIKASDAASSKAKGLKSAVSATNKNHKSIKVAKSKNEVLLKKGKLYTNKTLVREIILIQYPNDTPQSILARAINMFGGQIELKFHQENNRCKCTVFVHSNQIAQVLGTSQKTAKKEVAEIALRELRKEYYTIIIKCNHLGAVNVTTTSVINTTPSQESIPDDNVGRKLMKLMGWAGGGLGKNQQGIVNPVVLEQQISRKGIGLKSNSSKDQLKKNCKDTVKKYMMGDMKNDLIFSSEFTNDERAIIHQVARQMGLKSHSYGSKEKRTLVVSRNISIQDLVEELKSLGGSTDKYELIEPLGF
ncbi:NF-kappa-B-repressing factor [Prorops nasuta]|uniref:NF-kappa-B-repressing factor n=1 Tax=Prorops nasuta TaxID=863751 RepID=UPI0034CD19E5